MISEVSYEHVERNGFMVLQVVPPGTFDDPWDKATSLHEVTTAQDYAPRGPSPRQLDRHDIGSMIARMVEGEGAAGVAIGIYDGAPKEQKQPEQIQTRLKAVLEGRFNGMVLVANHVPESYRVPGAINPKLVLSGAISRAHVEAARWAVIDAGTQRNNFQRRGS